MSFWNNGYTHPSSSNWEHTSCGRGHMSPVFMYNPSATINLLVTLALRGFWWLTKQAIQEWIKNTAKEHNKTDITTIFKCSAWCSDGTRTPLIGHSHHVYFLICDTFSPFQFTIPTLCLVHFCQPQTTWSFPNDIHQCSYLSCNTMFLAQRFPKPSSKSQKKKIKNVQERERSAEMAINQSACYVYFVKVLLPLNIRSPGHWPIHRNVSNYSNLLPVNFTRTRVWSLSVWASRLSPLRFLFLLQERRPC